MTNPERSEIFALVPGGETIPSTRAFIAPDPLSDSISFRITDFDLARSEDSRGRGDQKGQRGKSKITRFQALQMGQAPTRMGMRT